MRITSYDTYRGILVIAMIVYHVLVNSTRPSLNQYRSMARIACGFIMITGIITGQFLATKPTKAARIACKLLSIYLLINLPLLGYQIYQGTLTFPQALSILLHAHQATISLEILLPLALTLLLPATISFLSSLKHNISIHKLQTPSFLGSLISQISFLAILLLILHLTHYYSYTLIYTLYGLLAYIIAAQINIDHYYPKNYPGAVLLIASTIILTYFLHTTTQPPLSILLIPLHTTLIYFTILTLTKWPLTKNHSGVLLSFIGSLLSSTHARLTALGQSSFVIYITHIIALKTLTTILPTYVITTPLFATLTIIFFLIGAILRSNKTYKK